MEKFDRPTAGSISPARHIGRPVPPTDDCDDFVECPVCNELIDCRDLGQVFRHIHGQPMPEYIMDRSVRGEPGERLTPDDHAFHLLQNVAQANTEQVVVVVARVSGQPGARVLLPIYLGLRRNLDYLPLETAANQARQAAAKHRLGLAVVVDPDAGLSWSHAWDAVFGPVSLH